LVEITSEIITEKFADKTIIEMSQTQLPTNAMVEKQVKAIQKQMGDQQKALDMAMKLPQVQQQMQQNPEGMQQAQQQFQQLMESGQAAIKKIAESPTIDQVLQLLSDCRTKSFVLDIETDSTIIPNEQQEKQQRTEFIGVLAQLMPQLTQMYMADPHTAEFAGDILKFATAPFRAGRSLDSSINNMVEMLKEKADQPRPDDPATMQNKTALQIEQMKQQTAQAKIKQDGDIEAAKLKQQDAHKQAELQNQKDLKAMELQGQQQEAQADLGVQNQKLIENREAHQATMLQKQQDMDLNRQKADMAVQAHQLKADDLVRRQNERQQAAQFKQQQAAMRPPGPL
jgi:hypothetical protein